MVSLPDWRASDFANGATWLRILTAMERCALEQLGAIVPSGDPAAEIQWLRDARSELLEGRGFAVVRGFPIERRPLAEVKRSFMELGRSVGALMPQNASGDQLQLVTDTAGAPADDDPALLISRGRRGRAAMAPHTDSADIAVLLCVRQAMTGGANGISCAAAIYNEVMRSRPDYMPSLCRGFHFDLSGKTHAARGFSGPIPVFSFDSSGLVCTFNKARIELGMRNAGLPLTANDSEAIDYVDRLAGSRQFSVSVLMEPGDMLMLNNRRTLHSREAFQDWPESARRRLLIRMWLQLPFGDHKAALATSGESGKVVPKANHLHADHTH